MSKSWAAWRAEWSAELVDLVARFDRALRGKIEANPEAFRARTAEALELLTAARRDLDAIKPKVGSGQLPAGDYNRLATRWHVLAAGIYSDAVDAPAGTVSGPHPRRRMQRRADVGAVPVLLIIGTVALGVAAIVAALALFEKMKALREEIAMRRAELDERIKRTPTGQQLPTSTLPEAGIVNPPDKPGTGIPAWLWLAGAGAGLLLLKPGRGD